MPAAAPVLSAKCEFIVRVARLLEITDSRESSGGAISLST